MQGDVGRRDENTNSFAVNVAIDDRGDRLDFRAQLLLDAVKVESVLECDEVDSQTKMPETARTSDSVKVGLGIFGEIKVDDNVDGLNVYATSEKVGAHEVASTAIAKFVENAVTIGLLHLGVNVEAAIAKLSNLLGQKLDAVNAVAENDALVDLELGKKRVESSDLLTLLNECVELSNTAKSKLVHEIDDVRIG